MGIYSKVFNDVCRYINSVIKLWARYLGYSEKRANNGGNDNVPEGSTEKGSPKHQELTSETFKAPAGIYYGCNAWQSIN